VDATKGVAWIRLFQKFETFIQIVLQKEKQVIKSLNFEWFERQEWALHVLLSGLLRWPVIRIREWWVRNASDGAGSMDLGFVGAVCCKVVNGPDLKGPSTLLWSLWKSKEETMLEDSVSNSTNLQINDDDYDGNCPQRFPSRWFVISCIDLSNFQKLEINR
jgi:hypothetical protein